MNKQNKINLIIIWISAILISISDLIFASSKTTAFTTMTVVFVCCCIITLIYKSSLSELIKAATITTIPAIGTIILSMLIKGSVVAIFCGFLALFVTTLYFNHFILLIHSCSFFACSLFACFKNTEYIAGKGGPSTLAILLLFTYALLAYLLYITTVNGTRLVQESNAKSELAIKQHEIIKERTRNAGDITDALNADVTELTAQMNSIADVSNTVSANRLEISRLSDSFAAALTEVSKKIHLTKQQNEDTFALADHLQANYKEVLLSSTTGKEQGELLTTSIMQMSSSVNDTLLSTNALLTETSTIHTIIGELKSISGQTNLLALNASIEAARVGSNEDGFGIVAEQIRELSEQSKEASDTMNSLLADLTRLITTVADKVMESVSVIDYSIASTKEIMNNMDQIQTATFASSANIEQELASMDNIRKHFVAMTTKLRTTVEIAKKNESMINTVSDSILNETNMIESVTDNINTIDHATVSIAQFFLNN